MLLNKGFGGGGGGVVIPDGSGQRFKTFGDLGRGEKSNVQLGRFLRFD